MKVTQFKEILKEIQFTLAYNNGINMVKYIVATKTEFFLQMVPIKLKESLVTLVSLIN